MYTELRLENPNIKDFIYTKKQICEICNVTERSFERFASDIDVETEFRNIGGSRNVKHYTEETLKAFQMWLLKNQTRQGKSSEIVKDATEKAVKTDLAITEIVSSGNIEAMKCLMEHYMNETKLAAENKNLIVENNSLRLELKEKSIELDEDREWYSIKRMSRLNPHIEFRYNDLKNASCELGLFIKKVFDANYGTVNSYNIKAYRYLYGEDLIL